MSGAPPPQPGDLGTDDDPLDIETDVLELLNNTVGVATVENLVGVAADNTNTDGTLVYPTANGAQGVPTDLAVRIDGVDRPVTAIEYSDATGTLRPVTEWHLGPLGAFELTLDSLTFVQPPTFDVAIASTTSPVAPGDTLDVTVEVTNTGDETGTQTVTLDIDNGVGQVDSANVTLSGGGSTTQTLSWSVPSNQTEQDYQATVSSADGTASQTVTVGLGLQLVDNFEDSPTGPYSSGDSISTYYSGDTGSFTRSTATSATGSFSLEKTTSDIISSQPGDGLPYYPQIGDRIEFYMRDDNGASPRVRFGMDGSGNGYQIYMRADSAGRRRFWVERVDSGTRVQLAQTNGLSFGRLAWVRIEVDWHDGSGSESNGTIIARLYDSNDNLLHTHDVTDTNYLNDRGIGFTAGVGSLEIADGYRRLGGV